MKIKKDKLAQSTVEYLIVGALAIAAVAAVAFLEGMKSNFDAHYGECVSRILE